MSARDLAAALISLILPVMEASSPVRAEEMALAVWLNEVTNAWVLPSTF